LLNFLVHKITFLSIFRTKNIKKKLIYLGQDPDPDQDLTVFKRRIRSKIVRTRKTSRERGVHTTVPEARVVIKGPTGSRGRHIEAAEAAPLALKEGQQSHLFNREVKFPPRIVCRRLFFQHFGIKKKRKKGLNLLHL
jgi:hypothetical protein